MCYQWTYTDFKPGVIFAQLNTSIQTPEREHLTFYRHIQSLSFGILLKLCLQTTTIINMIAHRVTNPQLFEDGIFCFVTVFKL